MSDDPGLKRVITKRGCEYPNRVMNSIKTSTSLMFAGSGNGALLHPYVVYKSSFLYHEWTKNGSEKPHIPRYNRSNRFRDWFVT